ncbi:MerR family transcriptional regulator [Rhizohabitans arisaemae]|uniref:MerR family transcriptional regulator n=1 Tax=Rhizohabitans arisaemae TaxID=2720610 RepID=UPI0024B0793D|nr:MerR family transcriptional regulator [Rhizohabitans arisaemae]
MDLYSIGRLAQLTGLPVKTIRYYSDIGVLPESDRSNGGYRLYGDDSRARLELVRTLRDLGVDLTTIRRLGEPPNSLESILRLQLRAVEAQLKALQRTRAVLRTALKDGAPTDQDLNRLNAFGRLGGADITALVDEFVEEVVGDSEAKRDWLGCRLHAMIPELPDEPSVEQLDAWLEVIALLSDPGFRESQQSVGSDFWETMTESKMRAWAAAHQAVLDEAAAALRADVRPDSPEAVPILRRITAVMARGTGARDDAAFRASMLRGYEEHDPRGERYWQLISVINGWEWPRVETVAHRWIHAALRAQQEL